MEYESVDPWSLGDNGFQPLRCTSTQRLTFFGFFTTFLLRISKLDSDGYFGYQVPTSNFLYMNIICWDLNITCAFE